MKWSDIQFTPPARTLRQFAALWLLFFGTLAGASFQRDGATPRAWALAGLALAVGMAGLCRPALVRPVFVGSLVLTFPIGWVVSKVVLAGLYYGVFTPLGLAFRLAGRDVLGLRFEPAWASYWEDRPAVGDARRYFRQF
jgi:hypothetical protein